ncbi:MAG: hypothetical protein PVJ67_02790 [Candidatus Pacearchaeota archaeon]|jgi:hypothetical protein
MQDKKTFLGMDYEKTKFHPVLSEYLEILAHDAQHGFPENFGGLMGWISQPKGTYGVDYFWIGENSEENNKLDNPFESRCRQIMQFQLDSIRNSVDAIGWLDRGRKLFRSDYSHLEGLDKSIKKFYPDRSLIGQVRNIFLNEMFINENKINPNNIFYYKQDGDLHRFSKVWLETISKGYESAKKSMGFLENKINLKMLALEGLKSLE